MIFKDSTRKESSIGCYARTLRGRIFAGNALYFRNIDTLLAEIEQGISAGSDNYYKQIIPFLVYGYFDVGLSIIDSLRSSGHNPA